MKKIIDNSPAAFWEQIWYFERGEEERKYTSRSLTNCRTVSSCGYFEWMVKQLKIQTHK